MKGQLLIDTSVWIDFFNGKESREVKILIDYIENDGPIFLTPTIVQEILQGISSDKYFDKIKSDLLAFDILNDDALEMALGAVNIYRKLRKKGVTIRKSNDCLIAHYANKHGLEILHSDRDFDMIKKYY